MASHLKNHKVNREFYYAVHHWLKYHFGKADKCESKDCLKKSKNYNWALKRGYKYVFERENFIQLCRSCHAKYDITENSAKKFRNNFWARKTHCVNGHRFNKKNTYLHIRNNHYRHRMCKICLYKNGLRAEAKQKIIRRIRRQAKLEEEIKKLK